jgi:hypothetical protein
MARVELASRDWHTLMLPLHHTRKEKLGRKTRFELVPPRWKPGMLPLHHLRILELATGVEPATY